VRVVCHDACKAIVAVQRQVVCMRRLVGAGVCAKAKRVSPIERDLGTVCACRALMKMIDLISRHET
jgi:hypothetical protein